MTKVVGYRIASDADAVPQPRPWVPLRNAAVAPPRVLHPRSYLVAPLLSTPGVLAASSGDRARRVRATGVVRPDPLRSVRPCLRASTTLLCGEITSTLDVSVQAAVPDPLRELGTDLGLALPFITHDLGVVARAADDVLVLERGKTVEVGGVEGVLHAPTADYTRRLINAAPSLSQPAPTAPEHEMLPQ